MKLSYAQPHHRGVTMIMGVGNDGLEDVSGRDTALNQVTALSAAAWVGGLLTGSVFLKNIGIGGIAATIGTRMLTKQPLPLPEPSDVVEQIKEQVPSGYYH